MSKKNDSFYIDESIKKGENKPTEDSPEKSFMVGKSRIKPFVNIVTIFGTIVITLWAASNFIGKNILSYNQSLIILAAVALLITVRYSQGVINIETAATTNKIIICGMTIVLIISIFSPDTTTLIGIKKAWNKKTIIMQQATLKKARIVKSDGEIRFVGMKRGDSLTATVYLRSGEMVKVTSDTRITVYAFSDNAYYQKKEDDKKWIEVGIHDSKTLPNDSRPTYFKGSKNGSKIDIITKKI